jgi:transposase
VNTFALPSVKADMGNPKGVKRDFVALERRRMQAVKLFDQGRSKAEVARRCRVSNQSAGRWFAAWQHGGSAALKHPGRAGRKSRLQPLERMKLEADLQRGPEKTLGHATALWTLPRIAALIRQQFGHDYSISQVSRLLRALGWSCQKPARRALEHDEQKIAGWKRSSWPAIKKKRVASGARSSSSTKAG